MINNELVCRYSAMVNLANLLPVRQTVFFSLEVDYVNCGNVVTCPAMLFKDGIQIIPDLQAPGG